MYHVVYVVHKARPGLIRWEKHIFWDVFSLNIQVESPPQQLLLVTSCLFFAEGACFVGKRRVSHDAAEGR